MSFIKKLFIVNLSVMLRRFSTQVRRRPNISVHCVSVRNVETLAYTTRMLLPKVILVGLMSFVYVSYRSLSTSKAQQKRRIQTVRIK